MAQMSTPLLWATRLGMGTLTRLIPPLGNRMAWRLFCTSPPSVDAAQDDEYFLQTHAVSTEIQCEGHTVPVYILKPPSETRMRVLLLHGWGSRATALLGLGKRFMREGAEVVLFDGPGSGRTGAKQTTLLHMLAVVGKLQMEHGPFDVAVGHSFGGLAAAHAIEVGALSSCKVLATIGSPNSFEEMTRRLLAELWMPKGVLQHFSDRVHALADRELQSFGIAAALAHLPAERLAYYCVHDHSDKEVPVSDGYEIERTLSWVDMEITQGLGHNRILRDAGIQKRVVEYAEQHFYGLGDS